MTGASLAGTHSYYQETVLAVQLELGEVPLLHHQVRVTQFLHQPHFQFAVLQQPPVHLPDLPQQDGLGLPHTHVGQQQRQAQSSGYAEIAAVVGETARPVHFEFEIDVIHLLLILVGVNLSGQGCREGSGVLVGDPIDESDPRRGHSGNHPHSLQLLVFVVLRWSLGALEAVRRHP